MNCELTGKKPRGRSTLATYLLAAMILLAVGSASGQQVHQLFYDNGWLDSNLDGPATPRFTFFTPLAIT